MTDSRSTDNSFRLSDGDSQALTSKAMPEAGVESGQARGVSGDLTPDIPSAADATQEQVTTLTAQVGTFLENILSFGIDICCLHIHLVYVAFLLPPYYILARNACDISVATPANQR